MKGGVSCVSPVVVVVVLVFAVGVAASVLGVVALVAPGLCGSAIVSK